MEYDNNGIRRQDRLLDKENAYALLRTGEYGILSMVGEEGESYAVPVNYAWDCENAIYIHCAPQGRKLRCIALHPRVSFCVVGRTHVVSRKFTTGYESIILTGHARTCLPAEERMQALRLILEKYAPNDLETGLKYAEKSFHRTEIIRIDLESMSGKCKRVNFCITDTKHSATTGTP